MKIPLSKYLQLLNRYLKQQLRPAILLFLLLLLSIAFQLFNPQLVRQFIDGALEAAPLATLGRIAVIFLVVTLFVQLLSIATTYLGEKIAWSATNELRADLLRHVLSLDPSYHKDQTPGQLLERIDGDVNALADFFSRIFVFVFSNLLLLFGVVALLFYEDWRIGIGTTIVTIIGLFVLIRSRAIAVPYWTRVRQIRGEMYGLVGEQLSATEDMRGNGGQSFVMQQLDLQVQRYYPAYMKAAMASNLLWPVDLSVYAIRTSLVFVLCVMLWRLDQLTLGSVYLIIHYSEMISRPLQEIRNQIESLQAADASIERINELLATKSKLVEPEGGGGALPAGPLTIQCDNLTFGYEDDLILQNISFTLRSGRVLGLLGRTGSGKTTLARLILRLYDPTTGQLTLGGVPPTQLSLDHLRKRVAMVAQEVQIFQATVRDNLTFFDATAQDAAVLRAIEAVGLRPWLQSLPNGLDTHLGAQHGLSAGQAQLLSFARVFLTDPGVVVLDEASSRLDPATERLVDQAVERLLENRTGVIIAHHLTSIQRTDDILILDRGQILEFGERAALAADETSHFSQLLRAGLTEALA